VSTGDARIHDRGYRPYEGPRSGVSGAVRSVALQSLRRGLGLRRPFWAKLPPALIIGLAFVPALVYVGIGALLAEVDVEVVPGYADYYGVITAALLLFGAWTAPEILCPDRRTGMLGLYFASPLSRVTYLLAKLLAIGAVLLAITLGPVLFLVVARWLIGSGPGLGDVPLLAMRMIVTAVMLSSVYGLLGAAIAALVDRRAIATAAVILFALAGSVATGVMVEAAEYPEWVNSLDVFAVTADAIAVIWDTGEERLTGLPSLGVIAVALGWSASCAAVVLARYRRIEVTR
jgi:ABC-2 type transport system permease protein